MKKTGKKVRILRESIGYSQTEMSILMDISQALYSQIENGNRRLTEDKLETLCELFGITTETFTDSTPSELLDTLFKISRELFVEHRDLQGNTYLLSLNQ